MDAPAESDAKIHALVASLCNERRPWLAPGMSYLGELIATDKRGGGFHFLLQFLAEFQIAVDRYIFQRLEQGWDLGAVILDQDERLAQPNGNAQLNVDIAILTPGKLIHPEGSGLDQRADLAQHGSAAVKVIRTDG